MATNRRHSLTLSVNSFNGIEIDLSLLRDIAIHGTSSVTLQGGAYSLEVWDDLWDAGYVTSNI